MNRNHSQVVSLAGRGIGRASGKRCPRGRSNWALRGGRPKGTPSAVTEARSQGARCQSEWQQTPLSEIKGDAMVLLSVEKNFFRGSEGYESARRATVWNGLLPDRFPDVIVQAHDTDDV